VCGFGGKALPAELQSCLVDELERMALAQQQLQELEPELLAIVSLSCQRRDDLFAIARPFALKNFNTYAPANAPVKHGQGGID